MLPWLLCCLTPLAAAWEVAADQWRRDGRPVAVYAVRLPLDARREGQPFDPAATVARLRALGANLVLVAAADGPGLEDLRALLPAARAAGLAVAVEPPGDRPESLAARLGVTPDLWVWPAAAPPPPAGAPLVRVSTELPGPPGAWLSRLPFLYRDGLGAGRWGQQLQRQREATPGVWWTELAACPPAAAIAAGALQAAAPHPDLYRDGQLREASVLRYAGEWLLVPEPAQLRLQAYAAWGSGARGVVWNHLGHLVTGPAPFSGAARALTVAELAREASWFAPYLASGEWQPLADLPEGLAGGCWQRDDEVLVLLWRDRRLDTRSVGDDPWPPLGIDLPCAHPAAGLQQVLLRPAGPVVQPADLRQDAVRVQLPGFDLTAAVLLTPRPPAALAQRCDAELPEVAQRTYRIAAERVLQVGYTLQPLRAAGRAAGGDGAWQGARELLAEAARALEHGYLRTALDLSGEAERATRAAQGLALEAACSETIDAALEPFRMTFAALPGLTESRLRPERGSYPLATGTPLSFGGDDLTAGSSPPRWSALPGFDQTVATLTVGPPGRSGGQGLRWQPAGSDAGALYLPFSPQTELSVECWVRLTSPPLGARLIVLASGADRAGVAGLRLLPDGTASSFPAAGQPRPWPLATWRAVRLRLANGRLTVTLDGQPLGLPQSVSGPLGALVLAKPPGEDAVAVELDDLRLTTP